MTTYATLRPWATMPEVNRAMRRMLGSRGNTFAFVALLPGAIPPEVIPAGSWRTVEGRPVAVVGLEVARSLAAPRHPPEVARDIARPPPPRGAWCLALGARGEAHAWSTPLTFLGARRTAPAGDA